MLHDVHIHMEDGENQNIKANTRQGEETRHIHMQVQRRNNLVNAIQTISKQ